MVEAEVVQPIFNFLKDLYGVDLAVLSYEGLLFDYKGDREEAEKLAALAPSAITRMFTSTRYVLIEQNGKSLLLFSIDEFTIVLRGDRKAIVSYIDKLFELVEGKEVRCPHCGHDLRLATIRCPRCGATIPFTHITCPRCGYTSMYRKCPNCGREITPRGEALVKDRSPLYFFSIAAAIVFAVPLILGVPIYFGAGGAGLLALLGYLMWRKLPVYIPIKG